MRENVNREGGAVFEKKTKHHYIPKSRKGERSDVNIGYFPESVHAAWHCLFINLCPWEVMQRIAIGQYEFVNLSERKKQAWLLVFGTKSKREVVAHVRKSWFPPNSYLYKYLAQNGIALDEVFALMPTLQLTCADGNLVRAVSI